MNKNKIKDIEIDPIKLLKIIYDERKFIFKFILFFSFIFILLSALYPTTYNSSLKFSYLSSGIDQSSNNLSNIASLAGINLNLNNNQNNISPKLYQDIISGTKFRRKLLNQKFNDTITIKDYILTKKNNYLSFNFFSQELENKLINIDSVNFVNENEKFLFSFLDKNVSISYDEKENSSTITCYLDDKIFVSVLTKNVFKILEKEVIDMNLKSSRDVLEFNQKSFDLKKVEFEDIQLRLSSFLDNNQVISSSKFNNQKFILENEFNLVNSVFQELAKQLELSKIQVTKETPIFIIIQDSYIDGKNSNLGIPIMLLLSIIMGILFSLLYIFTKSTFINISKHIKSSS